MQKMRKIFRDVRAFFGSPGVEGMEKATDMVLDPAAKAAKTRVTTTLLGGTIVVSHDGPPVEIERADDDMSDSFLCPFNCVLDINADDFGIKNDIDQETLVNYCSRFMNIKVYKDDGCTGSTEYFLRFEQGIPETNYPQIRMINERRSGVSIHWAFDDALWYCYTHEIPLSYFKEKLTELSNKYPKKTFILCIQPDIADPESFERYVFKKG